MFSSFHFRYPRMHRSYLTEGAGPIPWRLPCFYRQTKHWLWIQPVTFCTIFVATIGSPTGLEGEGEAKCLQCESSLQDVTKSYALVL